MDTSKYVVEFKQLEEELSSGNLSGQELAVKAKRHAFLKPILEKEQEVINDETISDIAIISNEDNCNKSINMKDFKEEAIEDNCIQNDFEESSEEGIVKTISNVSNLKELFNIEREKFTQNINEYIFELQEEIRKAREKM